MHCRECRFSEGQAEEAGGRTALRLYCMAKGGRALEVWWSGVRGRLERHGNLRVLELEREASAELGRLAERTMRLQFTIQDGHVLVTNGRDTVSLEPRKLAG